MLRILHISDIHFDAIYGKYPDIVRGALKSGVYFAFENAVNFAIEKDVDLVIISGDVCDRGSVSYKTENFMRKQMEKLYNHQISVVLLHGNHDPSSELQWNDIGDHVHVITSNIPTELEMKTRDDRGLYVSCNGFENKAESEANLDQFANRREGSYHIGSIHTYLSGSSDTEHDRYMTTTQSDLKALQYDYWALGHIHKREIFAEARAAYSGCIQALNAKETGQKGGLLVEIEEPRSHPQITFVPFSNVVFETLHVEIDLEIEKTSQLSDQLIREVFKLKSELDKCVLLVRIELHGMTSLYNELRKKAVLEALASEVREDTDVMYVDVKAIDISPKIEREKYVLASPFVAFIDNVLNDETEKDAFKRFALSKQFLEVPQSPIDMDLWMDLQIDNIQDEWLYKMVKTDDD